MKFATVSVFSFFIFFVTCSDNPVKNDDKNNGPRWELVWNDEFDSETIDAGKWNHEIGGSGWGNNELQYYTDSRANSFILNDWLVIEARKENFQDNEYTSARMTTRLKGDWQYGRIEVRARLPEGRGIWPAIWMMPTDGVYGGWPASGEIDIMELVGHMPATVYGTIHYGNSFPNNSSSGNDTTLLYGVFSDAFHTFSIEWEEGEIRWYLDGALYSVKNEWFTPNGDFPAPFDRRFFLILNLAVGGNWPGSPDATTQLPQRMYVEYVRVYRWVVE